MTVEVSPYRVASTYAAVSPAGPAPMMTTLVLGLLLIFLAPGERGDAKASPGYIECMTNMVVHPTPPHASMDASLLRPTEPERARAATAPVTAQPTTGRVNRFLVAAAVGAIALGIALRFLTSSHLWLDEALTVNIAK